MAYRDVFWEEIREVIRFWRAGRGRMPIAALVGLDPMTIRSYIRSAEACRIVCDGDDLSEERWTALMGG